ncbi:site-specific integrase, partial [Salmonella enterica subsp. enterica serovar Montevideo]|nr:site-specific integrase [Salmonella enterica subsp. enterica serovar Montevideo]
MMSGGNILALQKILWHHDIKMTMRYAHLAPDHLETALRFNTLALLPACMGVGCRPERSPA